MRTKNIILIIIAIVVVVILAGLIIYNNTQDSGNIDYNSIDTSGNNNSNGSSNSNSSSSASSGSSDSSVGSTSDSDVSNVTYGYDEADGVESKTVNGKTYYYSQEYEDFVVYEDEGNNITHMYNPDKTIDEYSNEETGHMWGYFDGKYYDEYW